MTKDETYIRSLALTGLPKFIKAHGGKPKALFEQLGLDINLLENPQAIISWPKSCRLLESAAEVLDMPNLGILWGLEIPHDVSNSGPSIYLASLMPDAISLLDIILKYQKIHTTGKQYSYSIDAERKTITGHIDFHPETPACRQFSEHIMAVVTLAVRRIIGPPFDTPLEVRFQHSEPEELGLHHDVFKCPIVFDAKRTEMTYDVRILDKEMKQRWKFMRSFLNIYLKRQQQKLPKTLLPITSEITGLIPYILASGKSDIVSVAHVLDMNPKKMQRLLKQEGTDFSTLLDSTRSQIAKRMLTESNMQISGIANMLGYSSNVPFANACKRWYGVSPRAIRQNLRG